MPSGWFKSSVPILSRSRSKLTLEDAAVLRDEVLPALSLSVTDAATKIGVSRFENSQREMALDMSRWDS